jgi:2-C-methyl-D-erythritol 4-phosphate cytidylyltransferase/2-C-methyl-D-erythritol 2,4-cyclodiphosphate synthase
MDNLAQSMIDDQHAGVVPAVEVEDTMSLVNDNFIESTISRETQSYTNSSNPGT